LSASLSIGARALLAFVRDKAKRSGEMRGKMWWGQKTIAEALGISLRSVNRYMAELKKAGLVTSKQRGKTSAMYQIAGPKSTETKFIPYSQYLETEHWHSVRIAALMRAGKRCQVCANTTGLEVHHNSYLHKGSEHEHLTDLVVLCRRCHSLFYGVMPC